MKFHQFLCDSDSIYLCLNDKLTTSKPRYDIRLKHTHAPAHMRTHKIIKLNDNGRMNTSEKFKKNIHNSKGQS
jgi:hypothetical protein